MATPQHIPNLDDVGPLRAVFESYPEIEAVYLFGSRASGKARADSDIDLGILPNSPRLKERQLDIYADLCRHGYDHVDLVFLDIEDYVLRYEVVRGNKLIYQREGFDRGGYYAKIVGQYLDFTPYLEVHRRALKERLADKYGS